MRLIRERLADKNECIRIFGVAYSNEPGYKKVIGLYFGWRWYNIVYGPGDDYDWDL